MRISGFILSFYLVFLAFQPALKAFDILAFLDSESCCSTTCTATNDEDQSANQENQENKACNPFQNCECCVCIKTENSPTVIAVAILHAQLSLLENEEIPLQIPNDFWQPPRVI